MQPLGSTLLIAGISLYQAGSSFFGVCSPCRFYPSCSAYAKDVIVRYGVMQGLRMTLGRLLRCHPWNPGGVDLPSYGETK